MWCCFFIWRDAGREDVLRTCYENTLSALVRNDSHLLHVVSGDKDFFVIDSLEMFKYKFYPAPKISIFHFREH